MAKLNPPDEPAKQTAGQRRINMGNPGIINPTSQNYAGQVLNNQLKEWVCKPSSVIDGHLS